MNKKKLLIIIDSYSIGGTIVSLHSLLTALNPNRVKVDVYSVSSYGNYKGLLPNCREIQPNAWLSMSSSGLNFFSKVLHKGIVLFVKILKHLLHKDIYPAIIRIGCNKINTMQYDDVICFTEQLSRYVCHYPAKKRIAWIHCDYSRLVNEANKQEEFNTYNAFDKVVCVSNYAKSQFDKLFPALAYKTMYLHNIINVDEINRKANDNDDLDDQFDYSSFCIVSAGRLDPIKQFHLIPSIAAQVKNKTATSFKWYIIGGTQGYSDELALIESEIKKNDLDGIVILLGEKKNVCPYIGKASLYVCTSKSESFPLVVNEAKALCTPVISNDFPSVFESIIQDKDGYVVNISKMPQTITDFIFKPLHISHCSIDNELKLKHFYELI